MLKCIKYFKYLKPYLKYEVLIFILISMSSVLALANPILLKVIIDRVLILRELYLLKYVIVALFIFYIINTLIMFCNGFFNTYVGQIISLKIRQDLLSHIQKIKVSNFFDSETGDFISKVIEDVSTITNFMSVTLISTLNDTLNLLATAIFMLYFSPKLACIAFILAIVQFLISLKFSIYIRTVQEKTRENSSIHFSFLKRIFTGIKSIKAFNSAKHNDINYTAILRNILNLNFKYFYSYYGYSTCMSFASFVGSVLIFSLGVFEIYKGNLSVGALFVFDMVSERFYQFTNNLVNLNINFQNFTVAINRTESIFSLEKETNAGTLKNTIDSSIEFQGVTFSYERDSNKPIVTNLSYKFETGKTYALVGASGCGKSSLLSLMLKFYNPSSGKILIGGKDIDSLDLRYLRNKISIVFQDSLLFDGTIWDNIRFGNKKVTDEQVRSAAKVCCIDDFILSLPDGYDTRVGEDGVKISGGQKQRICLARALLRESDIYIFDEALSNLDKKLEYDIFQNLQRKLKNKTQIYVTHNIKLIRNLQNILVINRGNIELAGGHELLIQKSLIYRELFTKGENDFNEEKYA
ncbi:MAG TPA: ABC transporter ATP-binding protein [Pseudobacteroides sp.]|uniref:ABC transporter ATP-binding protein n=1 Tax=Pseudobacteroides sp. TaxID=1968840 RepID=UPI002F93DD6A